MCGHFLSISYIARSNLVIFKSVLFAHIYKLLVMIIINVIHTVDRANNSYNIHDNILCVML